MAQASGILGAQWRAGHSSLAWLIETDAEEEAFRENRLGTRSEMIVLPRTPVVLFVGRYDGPIQPASLLNRTYRGRQLYGPILCYGWKGNNIQPMSKDVQAEMLDRLKDTEVRV